MKKKTIIIIIIILAVLAVIILALTGSKKQPEYSLFEVKRGILKQSVDATGKVESADRIELNFETTGRIAKIYVNVGDKVTAGQKLAELEAGALRNKVAEATASLLEAQANYQETLAGASAEDIRVSEDTVAQKEQDLITAQNNLATLEEVSQTELTNLKETAVTTIKNEINTAENAMEEVENTLNDPDAKDTLSIKNTGALETAKDSQNSADLALENSKLLSSSLNNPTDNEVLNALDDTLLTLEKVATSLSDTLTVLTNTLTSTRLSETELDTLKSNIKNQITKISTARTTVQTAKSNWTYQIVYYDDQIIAAQDDVEEAKKALQVASSQLSLKKSPPRQFEIDAAKANVDRARANVSATISNLNQAIIKAPLEGQVTKKNFEVGEQTSLSSPVLEMIGESTLQIEVDIPESDIAKVKVGQNADITLDAFTEDDVFAGAVVFVDPAETIIQDVVYYQVKIQLLNQKDKQTFCALKSSKI